MGRHCRELRLVLRIADLKEDSHTLQDAAATWLLGHTQRITFGTPFVRDAELLVEAAVHVPCAYLQPNRLEATLRRPNGAFRVFLKGRQRTLPLRLKGAARHALPVLNGNPCATAPCRTADNTRGAACCRDLTLDVMIPKSNTRLEALLRARKSPYLCKVDREDDRSIECEVISACSYLDPADDVSCVLHDRLLPNGRLAKPSICREWPELDEDEVAHPGCVVADDGKQ
jgi:hypothetical protein